MGTDYKGIDYSGGSLTVNRDTETGIRYGIIPENAVSQNWSDSSELDYGDPHCPECGNEVEDYDDEVAGEFEQYRDTCCSDYMCKNCEKVLGSDDVTPDEALGSVLDDGEYQASSDSSGDIWIFKSPYFTYAQFCSPCAPGACHLENPIEEPDPNNRAYCFGHDWFRDEDSKDKAPYPVFLVETGERVWADIDCPECGGEKDKDDYGNTNCPHCNPLEPSEDDITTKDHRKFYQFNKLVLDLDEDEDMWEALEAFMDKEKFWPNVWVCSDHGNWHMMKRDPKDPDKKPEEEHVHRWGPVEHARITGNPHRKCLDCKFVTLDLTDDEEEEEQD